MSYAKFGLAACLSLIMMQTAAAAAVHGRCYELMADKHSAQALPECKEEAARGDAEAQAVLGSMYREGDGVTRDYAEAMKWYSMAARQGNAYAQHSLGELYYHQRHDHVQALKWFILAASSGDKYMVADRYRFSHKMSSSEVAKAQRLAREFTPTPR